MITMLMLNLLLLMVPSTTLSATLSWREPPSGMIPDIIGLYFDSSVSYTVPNGSFTISGGTK